MKRASALASLSRDHHATLALALRLRRAGEADAAAAREAWLAAWPDVQRHFRAEEELLLPAYAAHGDRQHPLVSRTLAEHADLRDRTAELARGERGLGALHALGERLAAHVRMEERELFGLIEAALPPPALADLGDRLERSG